MYYWDDLTFRTNIRVGHAYLAFVAQHAQLDEIMLEAQSAAKQLNIVSAVSKFLEDGSNAAASD